MRITKKLSAGFLIASVIFSLNAPLAQAWDAFELANPASAGLAAFDAIMSKVGMNQQTVKNMTAQLNVARQKKTPPQVFLSFAPTNPTPGKKVTVTAAASYFLNDAKELYYTWVLKHSYCRDGATITASSTAQERSCDLDSNGKINIEDYKIEAARQIANGNFDWQRALGSDSPACATNEEKPDYCNLPNQYLTASNDHDGYEPYFGGNDQKDKPEHCYLHDASSGDEYEIKPCEHLFPKYNVGTNFDLGNERFWRTDPNSKDTANTGTPDGATVIGLGKTAFTWNYVPGDKVSVAVEGVSLEPTARADASYKTMWAIPNSAFETDLTDLPDSTSTETINPTTESITTDYVVSGSEEPTAEDITQTITTIDKSYSAPEYTVTADGAGKEIMERKATTVVTKIYSATVTPITNPDFPLSTTGYTVSYHLVSTSAPVMTLTDPELLSTDPRTFRELETDTKDLDSLLKNSMIEPGEDANDKKMTITLSYSPDQLLNDTSGTGESADTVQIQSSILNAADTNFLKYSWQFFLGSDIASSDSWQGLTLGEMQNQGTGISQVSGIGLQTIRLKLNFKESFLTDYRYNIDLSKPFYIKAVLRATENSENNRIVKDGLGSILIPIHIATNDRIKVFATSIDSSGLNISLDTTAERCDASLERAVCPITQNEIVGVSFNPTDASSNFDYLWTLDGKPLTPEITNSTSAYFPVLDKKGTAYTLALAISNKTTGEKASLIRAFEVVDPKINLETNDSSVCAPILLGNYVDLDGNLWPDYSTDSFEAFPGSTIKLKATSNPASLITQATWFVNGAAAVANTDGTLEISIPADMRLGETYTVGIGSLYAQVNPVKKLLNTKWDVPLTAFYEKQVGSSITIKMVDHLSSVPTSAAKINKQKVLASLFSELPAYVNFLFRIILTILLILFSTGMLFSVFPKQDRP